MAISESRREELYSKSTAHKLLLVPPEALPVPALVVEASPRAGSSETPEVALAKLLLAQGLVALAPTIGMIWYPQFPSSFSTRHTSAKLYLSTTV